MGSIVFYGWDVELIGDLTLSRQCCVNDVVEVVTVTTTVIFAVEGTGRKVCLLIGGLGQGFMMFWIGGYSAIHPQTTIVPASYVSTVAIYLYAVFYCIGFGPGIPWVVAGEVAPNHVRTAAMSLAIGVNWLFSFAISRVTPSMLEDHVWGVFRDVLHVDVGVGILWFAGDEELRWRTSGSCLRKDMMIRALGYVPGGRILGRRRSTPVADMRKAATDSGDGAVFGRKDKRGCYYTTGCVAK